MVMKREHPAGAPPCFVQKDNLGVRVVNIGQIMVWLVVQATEQAEAYMRIFEKMDADASTKEMGTDVRD